MINFKPVSLSLVSAMALASFLAACQPAAEQSQAVKETATIAAPVAETLVWEDLMPAGEDLILEKLYTEFYQEQERQYLNQSQSSLLEASRDSGTARTDVTNLIDEGSALDTMEQIGTYNAVSYTHLTLPTTPYV